MFQTLDEQIETTEGGHITVRERLVRFAGMVIVAAGLLAGLYFAIIYFE